MIAVRFVVDQYHAFAVSLVNCSRPVDVDGEVEAVELRLVKDSLFDMPCPAALAFSSSGASVEVAWAAPVAVARDEDLPVEVPLIAHQGEYKNAETIRPAA